jgi:hypothetical protein
MINEYYLSLGLEHVLEQVHQDFPGVEVQVEDRLRFYEYHFPNMESGQKRCTIRFKKDYIRIPWGDDLGNILPCFATRPDDKDYLKDMGYVEINPITVAHVKDFPLWAAKMDGYKNLEEMRQDIGSIYGVELTPDDLLSYYTIDRYWPKKD